eukprot:TRINITY_DN16692_c0_g1_i1.p1 TRINITY_DN16692_c0_g1~~TRINITY_DN16692_c0_g1_i1.p1  ORF type:complete len:154 (+),score=20.86 TRINITY_DN16692_c0_g1_i1:183-644(+)
MTIAGIPLGLAGVSEDYFSINTVPSEQEPKLRLNYDDLIHTLHQQVQRPLFKTLVFRNLLPSHVQSKPPRTPLRQLNNTSCSVPDSPMLNDILTSLKVPTPNAHFNPCSPLPSKNDSKSTSILGTSISPFLDMLLKDSSTPSLLRSPEVWISF